MKISLRDDFALRWQNKDPFEVVQGIEGKVYREKEGRKTLRFETNGEAFFLKLHSGVGWYEIIKNLFQMRLPIIGASNEWLAIKQLGELGVDTLTPVAYGEKGFNPARQKSFVITEELKGTLSLAKYVEQWEKKPPSYNLKTAINSKLAQIAKTLHENGINHRDLYLCHFLLDISKGIEKVDHNKIKFFLVDLHRAQIRSEVPFRWRVKDVASIYFSAMNLDLTKRDMFRFMKLYSGKDLGKTLREDKKFWQKVQLRAEKLYRRDWKCAPPVFF